MWFYGRKHWGEAAADDYFETFFAHFEHLATYPEAYPLHGAKQKYRRSVHRGKNVIYRVLGEDIEVVAIIGQQDIDTQLE